MSHGKYLVTYSLKENVTLAQYEAFAEVCKQANSYIICKEKSGKEHCHAYLEFDKPIQYVQLQRKFSKIHRDSKYSLQIKKAYNYGAVEYVVKDGSFETNLSTECLEKALAAAKVSKQKVQRGDLETILFEFCEYHEERGGTSFLGRSPDRLQLQQYWKDFCAYKKDWKYVDKSFAVLRRLEYGAEVLLSRWQDHQKASCNPESAASCSQESAHVRQA